MTEMYTLRPEKDYAAEQDFLSRRIKEIEKGMGKVAARTPETGTIGQPMDALDRARELTADMYKQVRVRPLDEALQAQLDWLGRAEANLAQADGEPKLALNRIALDRRLLTDLLTQWRAIRN